MCFIVGSCSVYFHFDREKPRGISAQDCSQRVRASPPRTRSRARADCAQLLTVGLCSTLPTLALSLLSLSDLTTLALLPSSQGSQNTYHLVKNPGNAVFKVLPIQVCLMEWGKECAICRLLHLIVFNSVFVCFKYTLFHLH